MSPRDAVCVVGIDHRSAGLALLERAAAARRDGVLAGGAPSLVPVATCHRLELYLEGVDEAEARALFARWVGQPPDELARSLRVLRGAVAGEHLLRVAAGLESAVLGEDQILGQLRAAYRQACDGGLAGPLLHRLFHAAFRAGRRVRSETELAGGGRSLAGSGVGMLAHRLGGLEGRSVLVLGAGEMASLAAHRLRERGVGRLFVANRTRARADELAAREGALAVSWACRERLLARVDGVVCGTGAPEPVLGGAALQVACRGRARPLVVVDLAMPRNVEAPAHPSPLLELLDVESLSRLLASDGERRRAAIADSEAIVAETLAGWVEWTASRESVPGGCRARRASA